MVGHARNRRQMDLLASQTNGVRLTRKPTEHFTVILRVWKPIAPGEHTRRANKRRHIYT